MRMKNNGKKKKKTRNAYCDIFTPCWLSLVAPSPNGAGLTSYDWIYLTSPAGLSHALSSSTTSYPMTSSVSLSLNAAEQKNIHLIS